ncbi:MAG: tetratricopeptide repeat protein [Candidatus Alcyoniella australis]|nr:tetratricopeptide repeat protein [Candidatus Alcyoniella australis]
MKLSLRRISPVLLLSILLLVWAQPVAAQRPMAMAAPASYPRLAFLGYTAGDELDPVYVEELVHLTQNALRRTYSFEVIQAADCLSGLLEGEAARLFDCRGKSCLRDAGRVLDAQYVAAGTIEPFADRYRVRLTLVDADAGRVVRRSQVEFDPTRVFPEASLKRLAWDLLQINDEQEVLQKRRRMFGLYNARVRAATQALSAGREQQAAQLIEQAVGLLPDEAEAWIVAASAARLHGDTDRAEELIERALSGDPDDVGALQVAADFFERIERFERAAAIYADLAKLEPDVLRWVALQADALMQAGRREQALSLYQQSIRSHPDSAELAVSYADALTASGLNAQCLQWCSLVSQRFPDNVELYGPLGRALAALGHEREALELLEVFVERIGPRAAEQKALWPLYLQTDQRPRMFATLTGLFQRDPRLIGLHIAAAEACLDAGDDVAASEALKQALVLDPLFQPAYSGLVYVEQRLDEIEQAERYFRRLERKHRNQTSLPLYYRAVCHWMLGHNRRAIALYSELLQREPQHVQAHIDLARLYMQRKSYDRAEVYLERAANLDPQRGDARLALGDLYFMRREWPRAKRAYQQAIALEPSDPAPYHSLVEVLLISGDASSCSMVLQSCEPRLSSVADHLIQEYLSGFYALGMGDRQAFDTHLIMLARWYKAWSEDQQAVDLNWDFDPIREYLSRFQGRDRAELSRVLDLLEQRITLAEFLEQMGIPDAIGIEI